MAKKIVKKLVHLNDFQIKKDQKEFQKLLEIKNQQLQIALQISPDFKTSSIEIVDAIGNYLKSLQANQRLSIAEVVKKSDFEKEYSKLQKLESEINSIVLRRFGKYINFYNNSFIASDEFVDAISEEHSIYLTNPRAIEVYEKTEKFLELYNELFEKSFLSDRMHQDWRLANALNLVRISVENKMSLEPNWIVIKDKLDE